MQRKQTVGEPVGMSPLRGNEPLCRSHPLSSQVNTQRAEARPTHSLLLLLRLLKMLLLPLRLLKPLCLRLPKRLRLRLLQKLHLQLTVTFQLKPCFSKPRR